MLLLAFSGLLRQDASQPLPLVPLPSHLERHDGAFRLDDKTVIVAKGREATENAKVFRLAMVSSGLPFKNASAASSDAVTFKIVNPSAELGAEGYHLEVTQKGVEIDAATSAGLFYGIQTFRQLLPPESYGLASTQAHNWEVPCVSIDDRPRFSWRGMMLDVSRHFYAKGEILKMLDMMAAHKLNRFHWHLTDDPGWRIEIKRYPSLTKVGSTENYDTFRRPKDGQNHGGYYTQTEVREVVNYAKNLHITVVPEIEMPGHSGAAIASYPELGIWNGPKKADPWAFESSNLNTEDSTVKFYENVLDEVLKLFPSPWIHVGGDEVDKGPWKKNARTQELIKQRGLKDEDQLQSWFIRQIDHYLTAHGRRLIGWDEILEGGLAKGATVMSWRGIDGGIAAARAGHDAVMSPTGYMYFDYYQAKQGEPRGIGGFVPLERVYSYEPVPEALTADDATRILGVQGNIWCEYIATPSHMEYMAWPRGCALAEVGWSQKSDRSLSSFIPRLRVDLQRLAAAGMNYRKLDQGE